MSIVLALTSLAHMVLSFVGAFPGVWLEPVLTVRLFGAVFVAKRRLCNQGGGPIEYRNMELGTQTWKASKERLNNRQGRNSDLEEEGGVMIHHSSIICHTHLSY